MCRVMCPSLGLIMTWGLNVLSLVENRDVV